MSEHKRSFLRQHFVLFCAEFVQQLFPHCLAVWGRRLSGKVIVCESLLPGCWEPRSLAQDGHQQGQEAGQRPRPPHRGGGDDHHPPPLPAALNRPCQGQRCPVQQPNPKWHHAGRRGFRVVELRTFWSGPVSLKVCNFHVECRCFPFVLLILLSYLEYWFKEESAKYESGEWVWILPLIALATGVCLAAGIYCQLLQPAGHSCTACFLCWILCRLLCFCLFLSSRLSPGDRRLPSLLTLK